MLTVRPENKKDFEKIVSGELTFYIDAKILSPGEYAKKGDYVAINEYDGDIDRYYNTGRCVLMEVSAVVEEEDYFIYALQPCRVEPHRRLTAAVYGGKEGGSDDT